MVRIYTKTGDSGDTSLLTGGRVGKDHARIEAYGTLDELSSVLGLLYGEPLPEGIPERLRVVQVTLLEMGAVLADAEGRYAPAEGVFDQEGLERWIDGLEADLPRLTAFILPGGCRAAALAHVARTVCRRAERRVKTVADLSGPLPAGVLPYLNRLSDLLFVLARSLNARVGVADPVWRGR